MGPITALSLHKIWLESWLLCLAYSIGDLDLARHDYNGWLCENVTLSTKPEVYGKISTPSEKDQAVGMQKIWQSLIVWFSSYLSRQIDKQI